MVQMRVVLTDLRRGELTAAQEADRVKAAARAPPEAPAQHAPHGGNRRTSGADDLRTQSQGILAERPEDPKPDEAVGTESMAEDDEQEAKDVLRAGLEQAIALKEDTVDAYAAYVPDTEKEAGEQARPRWHTGSRRPISWLRPKRHGRWKRSGCTGNTARH